ncbi:hypothetical protein OG874_01460 [Nocardia sp. NBC_00565]|uniref:hypothetical protein n=1 Tax=Nocardia sp. NBC_00565 TaxID=2975993 RepID=UPI002E823C9F|nr:hypothetical protein [Nocardia sp. NBC_00565]WUC03913.1 hypothetical protein OG874_01460 [Nocardia sp. NBC_00565]
MGLPNGRRYAEYIGPVSTRDRVTGLLRALVQVLPRRRRLHPRDAGGGYHGVRREFGRWVLRPMTGPGSRRWISKPHYATRAIPRNNREAAIDWSLEALGI